VSGAALLREGSVAAPAASPAYAATTPAAPLFGVVVDAQGGAAESAPPAPDAVPAGLAGTGAEAAASLGVESELAKVAVGVAAATTPRFSTRLGAADSAEVSLGLRLARTAPPNGILAGPGLTRARSTTLGSRALGPAVEQADERVEVAEGEGPRADGRQLPNGKTRPVGRAELRFPPLTELTLGARLRKPLAQSADGRRLPALLLDQRAEFGDAGALQVRASLPLGAGAEGRPPASVRAAVSLAL